MGLWEKMNNPIFNVTEFSNIKNESGSNGFVLSAKQWIEKTNAIGIISNKEWHFILLANNIRNIKHRLIEKNQSI